jgi:hypothetical protein
MAMFEEVDKRSTQFKLYCIIIKPIQSLSRQAVINSLLIDCIFQKHSAYFCFSNKKKEIHFEDEEEIKT